MSHVLVVDDEEDIRELVRMNLIGNGLQVTTATSGEEALTAAIRLRPDLIILDVVMMGLSGLEVCRLLKSRKDTGEIPIIIMSVLGREIDRKYVADVGADGFVTKPFETDDLLRLVDELLN